MIITWWEQEIFDRVAGQDRVIGDNAPRVKPRLCCLQSGWSKSNLTINPTPFAFFHLISSQSSFLDSTSLIVSSPELAFVLGLADEDVLLRSANFIPSSSADFLHFLLI